jgi:hypothetical protein
MNTAESNVFCEYCGEEFKEGDNIVCMADPNQKIVKGVSPKFKFFCERCHLLIDNL